MIRSVRRCDSAAPATTCSTAFLPCDFRATTARRRCGASTSAPHFQAIRRTSLQALRARAGQSPFPRLIDRAIAGDARIVEVGCGTGQMCLYLARAHRVIVGADLTRASLALAAGRLGASGSMMCNSSRPISSVRASRRARSTSCIRPACYTIRRIRARRSRASHNSRGPAG